VVPFELGLTENVPSALTRQLAQLLVLAVLIGWSYKDVGPGWIGALAKLLLLTEVTTGFLMFNKSAVLIVIMAAGLGNYFRQRRLRNLLFTALAGLLIYMLIGPWSPSAGTSWPIAEEVSLRPPPSRSASTLPSLTSTAANPITDSKRS